MPKATASAATPRIAAGRTSSLGGASVLLLSEAIRPEADIADLAALRALAHVLGELLRVHRLRRAVLALDARDDERLAVGGDDRSKFHVGKGNQLHADAAVRPFRDF